MKNSLPLILLMILGFVIAISCGKKVNENQSEIPSTISTVYERSNPADIDPSPFGNHVIKIEVITFNDVYLDRYKIDRNWTQYVAQNIDLSQDIKRYTYDYTHIQVIEIPLITNREQESVLIYTTKDTFFFASCDVTILPNNNLLASYRPIGSSGLYYSIEVNQEYFVGDMTFVAEMPYSSVFGNNREDDPNECMRQPFFQCMNCEVINCARKWHCRTIWFTPGTFPVFMAGMTIVCS